MKRALFLVRTAPYGSASIAESVRLCLGYATMPYEISYLLTDDAVYALQPNQDPSAIGGNNVWDLIANLPDLDVKLYADAHALAERSLSVDGLDPEVQALSHEEIAELIANTEMVLTY